VESMKIVKKIYKGEFKEKEYFLEVFVLCQSKGIRVKELVRVKR
jgi:hypothetical protein